jgi:hypothetical protein
MPDTDNTQDRELTTEQIATAGTGAGRENVTAPTGRQGLDDADPGLDGGSSPLVAGHTAATGADHRAHPDGGLVDHGARASLLEDGELQSITTRWKDIQAEFVDEPAKAVHEADALVAELMQRLAAMFTAERSALEERWAGDRPVSTEDLRQGLRRYRSFFERLLAA